MCELNTAIQQPKKRRFLFIISVPCSKHEKSWKCLKPMWGNCVVFYQKIESNNANFHWCLVFISFQAPTYRMQPVTPLGILSLVLNIMCGALNLIRGVHLAEYSFQVTLTALTPENHWKAQSVWVTRVAVLPLSWAHIFPQEVFCFSRQCTVGCSPASPWVFCCASQYSAFYSVLEKFWELFNSFFFSILVFHFRSFSENYFKQTWGYKQL